MSTFITSDQHYNHAKILDYCTRPFASVEEMNNTLINNHNAIIKPTDTVYILGDLGFDVKDATQSLRSIIQQLNGTKYLIKGNHDSHSSNNFWLDSGIKEILSHGYELAGSVDDIEYKFVLSHKPMENRFIEDGYMGLHGHLHNSMLNFVKFNKDNHFDIGVDGNGFMPWKLEDLAEKYKGE